MKLVSNNPYRIVGLLVGATAREQNRQIDKLKMFLDAEQEPESDFSFQVLDKMNRNLQIVEEAVSKLYLDSDKITAALFWFYDGKTILNTDEKIFTELGVGDIHYPIEEWTKLTSSNIVTQRNASAFNNLATLYLSGFLKSENSNE